MGTMTYGRVAGTLSEQRAIVVDGIGRLILSPEAFGDTSTNQTFVMARSAGGMSPTVVTDQPAELCRYSLYNTQSLPRWLIIWAGTPPEHGMGNPVWMEYLTPQDKSGGDFGRLILTGGFSFAFSASPTEMSPLAEGEITALNFGYRT